MASVALYYLLIFGVLTIAGGVMGFVKAKSRASLIAGVVSGGLLIAASSVVFAHPKESFDIHVGIHLVVGLVVSLALAIRFILTFRRSRKMMPAGLMALLGACGVLLSVLGLVVH